MFRRVIKNNTPVRVIQIVFPRQHGLENTTFTFDNQVFPAVAKVGDESHQSLRFIGIQLIGEQMIRLIFRMLLNQFGNKVSKIGFSSRISAMPYYFSGGYIEAGDQGWVPCR
jgi:hypothetical protein